MEIRSVVAIIFLVSFSSSALVQTRYKRQWGEWGYPGESGGPAGWQQRNWNRNMNRNHIAAKQQQYNCQTFGINLVGLPISSYNCQNSGASARVNAMQHSRQNQGFVQGPLAGVGGLLSSFVG